MARSRLSQVLIDPEIVGRSRSETVQDARNSSGGRQGIIRAIRPTFIQTITRGSSMSRTQSDTLRYGDIRAEDLFPGSIDTVHIANAAITTAKIQNAAITTALIADASISTAKIQNAAITSALILDAAIVSSKIADSAVITAKIADASISSAKILDAAIITAKIADAAIVTALINDLSVTNAKINDVSAGKITAGLLNVQRLNITGIIMENFVWTDNSPGAGSVAWSAGTLVYKGVAYSIAGSNTSNRYVYWLFGGTSFTTNASFPTLTDDDFMIAINNSGTHDLYFNAPVPPVKGIPTSVIDDLAVTNAKLATLAVDTANIVNSAITNAKINDLSASKINAGTLDASLVTVSSADGKMTMANNIFQVKDGSDVIQLTMGKYDGTNYGIAFGTTPASPDILITSTAMTINTTSFVKFAASAKCLFQSAAGTKSALVGYIIENFVVQGDSTNGLNLYGGGGNISLGETTGSYGSGNKVIFIPNRSAAPSSNPTAGGIMYAESGALKWRGSSGTVTTIAAA